jgi:hypothetical protein
MTDRADVAMRFSPFKFFFSHLRNSDYLPRL